MTLVVDGASTTSSRAGDCVTFDADLPHHFENTGKEEAACSPSVAGLRQLHEPRRSSTRSGPPTRSATNLLYIDLHLVHEVTSPQAFDGLRLAGRRVRRPDRTLATADHNVPDRRHAGRPRGSGRALARAGRDARAQLRGVRRPCLQPRLRPPGHRPRDRPRAGHDPAGHDDRLRRQPHRHARRVRRAGVRHRHQRGRARAGDADHRPAQAEGDAHPLRGRARPRRHAPRT